jgi:hypothetical protein
MNDFDESEFFSASAIGKSKLSGYYRIPGLHVIVPTKGKFLTDFKPTMNNEIPIYPMKASDEMLLKNPDALMSGLALEKLFESCIPCIGNPREISMPDVDTLLIGIRAATYGEKMPLDVECPSCKSQYDYICDLPSILGTMTYVNEDNCVKLSEQILVYVKPYTLKDASEIAFLSFDEMRELQNMQASIADDEEGRKIKTEKMNDTMKKISDLTLDILVNCILHIVVPEGVVSDKKEIKDFLKNISKAWYEMIDNRVKDMNNHGIDKKLHIVCDNCKHEWDSNMEIDPTSFFDAGS